MAQLLKTIEAEALKKNVDYKARYVYFSVLKGHFVIIVEDDNKEIVGLDIKYFQFSPLELLEVAKEMDKKESMDFLAEANVLEQ